MDREPGFTWSSGSPVSEDLIMYQVTVTDDRLDTTVDGRAPAAPD